MPAPHLPADAYLSLLTYGRAGASILPADVRLVAAKTLSDFTVAMQAGMAPKPAPSPVARRSCTECPHIAIEHGAARCLMRDGALVAHQWSDGDAAPCWCPLTEAR